MYSALQCLSSFRELVRYCFMQVLQNDLLSVKHVWNQHRVRVNRFVNSPSGKPNMLYDMPTSYGGQQHGILINHDQLNDLERYVSRPDHCLPEYKAIYDNVVTDHGLAMPTNKVEAARLYANIMDKIY